MPENQTKRDQHGRFAPGHAGGPGRPRRQTEATYLAALSDQVPLDVWARIAERAVADAITGDAKARDWLSRVLMYMYMFGKKSGDPCLGLIFDTELHGDIRFC